MTENQYDVMIVGTGPAGSTAAFYGQRLGLKTVVFGDTPGGITYMIENLANYPGFVGGIPGTEFGVKLFQQAQMEGAMFTMSRLEQLDHNGNAFTGTDANGRLDNIIVTDRWYFYSNTPTENTTNVSVKRRLMPAGRRFEIILI